MGTQSLKMTEQLILKGTLEGHSGWVTSLATSLENPNLLLSGSRDKTLIQWNLTRDESSYGYPKRSLHGHSHIVSDVVISSDGAYALSASGGFPPVPPPADLSDTPTMFSLSPSQPTTDKSFLDPATAQSSSGTPSVTASSLSLRRDTPIGFLALDSALTPRTQSLSAVDGTSLLRSGSFLPADCRPTTSDTPATSTPLPSPPTDLSALPVARTELQCSGT